jgi:hypothetical protein
MPIKNLNSPLTARKSKFIFPLNRRCGKKMLNSIISDAFYRELFMSPCLSG